MFIKSLKIENWRNYELESIEFFNGQNLIFGENAQGKTNLIEAIFYLSCLKTFRSTKEADAIRHEKEAARLLGVFSAYGRELEICCDVLKSGRRLSVNGIRQTKPSEHIGLIKTVVFNPNDLLLIKEGPAVRRRFLNIALSQMKPFYIKALSEHNKLIENKRKILRMEDKSGFYDFYDILNEKLARVDSVLIRERGRFLKELGQIAGETGLKLSCGKEELSFVYKMPSSIENFDDEENKRLLLEHLKRRKEAELASGMCLVGAHRDDFEVLINGDAAKDYGSQGQIRSAVLAIKVAEHELLRRDGGEAPILLLDDVLSELDPSRRSFLLNDIDRGQTIITGCDPSMFSELSHGRIFTVSSGRLISKTEN